MVEEKSVESKVLKYPCTYDGCKFQFNRKDRFKAHLRVHTGSKFACQYENCMRSYVSVIGLKRHINRNHKKDEDSGKPPTEYKCLENGCNRVFQWQSNLKKHTKTYHAGKDYKCSHCDSAFRKSRQLKIHEASHTGVPAFKCTYEGCDKSFMLPSKLNNHLKHHEGYKCDIDGCEDRFDKWSMYQKHKKLQHCKSFECNKCKRSFKCKSNLRSHMKTHSETRTLFICTYDGCPKFFYYNKNLKHHISSTHEGKRHCCTFPGCEMEFKHKVTLMKHLYLHNKKSSPVKLEKSTVKKQRKDAGTRKKSAAALITGYQPDLKSDLKLIDSNNKVESKLELAEKMIEVIIIDQVNDELLKSQ